MTNGNNSSNNNNGNNDKNKWPNPIQLVLVVVTLLFSGFLFVVLPIVFVTMLNPPLLPNETNVDMWGTLIAVLLGLTTMTVTAIFLFMTFRIDREVKEMTKLEAHKVAKKEVRRVVKDEVEAAVAEAEATVAKAEATVYEVKVIADVARIAVNDLKNGAETAKKDIKKYLVEFISKMTLQEKEEFMQALRDMIKRDTGGFWKRLRGKFFSDNGKS